MYGTIGMRSRWQCAYQTLQPAPFRPQSERRIFAACMVIRCLLPDGWRRFLKDFRPHITNQKQKKKRREQYTRNKYLYSPETNTCHPHYRQQDTDAPTHYTSTIASSLHFRNKFLGVRRLSTWTLCTLPSATWSDCAIHTILTFGRRPPPTTMNNSVLCCSSVSPCSFLVHTPSTPCSVPSYLSSRNPLPFGVLVRTAFTRAEQ